MAIPFIREFAFAYGEAAALTPRITRLIADNPGPFTYTGTGVFIIGGEQEVAVIDPGPDTPAHRATLFAYLADKTVTAILLTHHHLDHTPLARPLAEAHDCPVYGAPLAPQARREPHVALDEDVDTALALDNHLSDGDILSGPDWTLMALHTPGHTSNHLCYALVEENALFTGDHIMGWSTSVVVPPDGSMADYMASLRRVRDADFARLYPTHGTHIDAPRPFIEAYIAHRLTREQQALSALSATPRTVPDMVAEIYADTDPRLHPAAAQSLLAHLIHLAQQGKALSTEAGWTLIPRSPGP